RQDGRTRVARRGLGTISTQMGNSLVFSSDVVGHATPRGNPPRWINTANPVPVVGPMWGGNPPRYIPQGWGGGGWGSGSGWSAGNSPYGSSPSSPSGNTQDLQQATLILQSNPSLLTQQQFS